MTARRLLPLLLALAFTAHPVRAGDTPRDLARRMQQAKDRVFPALVHIMNVEENFVGGRRTKSASTGSGFFIDKQGHIVTNYHVAGQAKRLFVTLANHVKLPARLVAGDPYTDLAVIQVDPKRAFLGADPVCATLGDSSRLRTGDFVMAMGSPLSLSRSISFGIVSCRDRALSTMHVAGHETGKYNTWLQTDAAINPGNSGGPLVNLAGEVVGVNSRANLAANNIGFAIPSNVVKEVVTALIRARKVERAWLGLKLQPLDAVAETGLGSVDEGVLVAAVAAGSPAAAAGIRPGDFIVGLAGKPFGARFAEQLPGLYRRISKLEIDAKATLRVRRGTKSRDIVIKPRPLGRDLGRETEVKHWGLTVRGITPRMRLEMGLPDTRGVIVTGVRPGGAASGRLEKGDIIIEVSGKPITGLATFLRAAIASIKAHESLVRMQLRRGSVVDVTVLRPRFEKESR